MNKIPNFLQKYELLKRISSPEDLKNLPENELPRLAGEIRQCLIETLAPIGGHIGANLGVVELTIALHRVFDSPNDLIVWDVGHQAYVHKMLTGRLARLDTIRQKGGLSGFTNRFESVHDPFGAGHACTSISAATGFACARDLRKMRRQKEVIAVIGDGALGGGMAFEAMNHAGALATRLLVVLNDNEMSIAPNVGALAGYLSRLLTASPYLRARRAAKDVLRQIPGALELARKLEAHTKGVLTPGGLFEELGFRYLGPIDGHDLSALIDTFRHLKNEDHGPVLLHVVTKKGFGFPPAEAEPEVWHGIGPFDPATGKLLSKSARPSWTRVFSDALIELADQDARIVAITAAMPSGTGLDRFAKAHPERCFDVGIAEQHAVTFAAGLAASGMRPFVAIYSTFLQRGYDQLIHDVALQKLPVRFCLDRAGIVGQDGATHAGIFDLAYLRCVPNLVVMAPSDAQQLADMLETARLLDGPSAIRYPRGEAIGERTRAARPLAVGKARVVRDGDAGVVVAVGARLPAALGAVERDGRNWAVIDLRFVKPLDWETLKAKAGQDRPVIVVEEGVVMGGVGEAIVAGLVMRGWQGKARLIGVPDVFPAHGKPDEILADLGLDAAGIARVLAEL